MTADDANGAAQVRDTPGMAENPKNTSRATRHIALVAHDNMKASLLEWAKFNKGTLSRHHLYATGTTGSMLSDELRLPVHRFLSGPVGGDQQVGAKIAEGSIDMLVFFWDPLSAQPHDPDVKALLRLGAVYNIPMASNVATADFLISSPLFHEPYERVIPDFGPRKWEELTEGHEPGVTPGSGASK